jgi:hypothetical protein
MHPANIVLGDVVVIDGTVPLVAAAPAALVAMSRGDVGSTPL